MYTGRHTKTMMRMIIMIAVMIENIIRRQEILTGENGVLYRVVVFPYYGFVCFNVFSYFPRPFTSIHSLPGKI